MEINIRPFLSRVIFSPSEKRFRTGWRIMIQSSLLLFFLLITNILFILLSFTPINIDKLYLISSVAASLLAITLSIYLSRKFLDHRNFVSLGLEFNSNVFYDLLVGTLIPGLMMGLIFCIEYIFGWITINGFVWNSLPIIEILIGLASSFLLYIAVAWQEELLSRGYHLQNLMEGISTSCGVLTSSLLFSFLHLLNPYASWRSVIGITLAGIFLCYAYLRTHQLWLSIGLHLGWNFFQGPIFGFPVSGTESFMLIKQSAIGPEIITGGLFGPEAGLILLPALLLGFCSIYFYSLVQQKIIYS